MKHYSAAVIPGDGIGPEVMEVGLSLLQSIADIHGGISFQTESFRGIASTIGSTAG